MHWPTHTHTLTLACVYKPWLVIDTSLPRMLTWHMAFSQFTWLCIFQQCWDPDCFVTLFILLYFTHTQTHTHNRLQPVLFPFFSLFGKYWFNVSCELQKHIVHAHLQTWLHENGQNCFELMQKVKSVHTHMHANTVLLKGTLSCSHMLFTCTALCRTKVFQPLVTARYCV